MGTQTDAQREHVGTLTQADKKRACSVNVAAVFCATDNMQHVFRVFTSLILTPSMTHANKCEGQTSFIYHCTGRNLQAASIPAIANTITWMCLTVDSLRYATLPSPPLQSTLRPGNC